MQFFTLGWERTAVSRRTQTLLKRSVFKNHQYIRHRRAIIGNFKVDGVFCCLRSLAMTLSLTAFPLSRVKITTASVSNREWKL